MSRADLILGDFLKAAASDRGPWNCSTLPADWCVALGHADFAAEWRDFVEVDDCTTVSLDAGGLVELWESGIGNGLPRLPHESAEQLSAGDIAVVTFGGMEAGAIWSGKRWAMKGARGLHFVAPESAAIVKAWRP